MKIQCNVCEAAEAKVLCCADEAALCLECDEKVHAANKLASKHQRVLLSRSDSQMPKCDICQDATGYFFCLEDRALLCRKCDVAIHTANSFVSSHQRFLLTGVQVGLDPAEPGASITNGKSHSGEKMSETECYSMSKRGTQISISGEFNKNGGELLQPKTSCFGGYGAGSIPQWQLDEFLGYNDYNLNGSCMDHDSSKADSGKLGDSDCSSILRSAEDDDLDDDERLGEVPQTAWKVPRTASPPTASGLHWSKTSYDDAAFVPDICSSPVLNSNSGRNHRFGSIPKRRRQF